MRVARIAIGAGVLAGSIALGGVAGAWLSAGPSSGAAAASTSGMLPVTVTALAGGDAPSTLLAPGGSAEAVLRLSNPNAFAVTLVAASSIGAVTASGGTGTCVTTGVSFAEQTGLHVPLAASSTTLVRLPGAVSMSTDSDSGCQGATFDLPVSVTVEAS